MNITEIAAPRQKTDEPIRLAAYCRVSSDSEDQLHSFAAQIRHYSEYTKEHPEYRLVDIYADEGLSGTDMKKRDEQNRMIRDCKKGKIDRVIVKPVSRFARNTEELLVTLRLLKEIDVSVYFEEQGIDTDKLNMEMIVTFPGMAAQQESVALSGNMRWSYQKRMQSGDFNSTNPAYGFQLKNGQLVPEEGEAQVVRRIFALYLQGMGSQKIANLLNEGGILLRCRKDKWCSATARYIRRTPMETATRPQRTVRQIPATVDTTSQVKKKSRQLRVAAYCRVSTKQDEQLESYERQVKTYTDRIHAEPGWTLVGIFADKGITGTSTKKRDEFNKMIRKCKQGKIDLILTKSIARFSRNTVDCLQHTRLLKDLGVDVFFEEQGIHSIQPGAEFYITIYGSVAQSESENISANVRWGKAQSAKEGNVCFQYKNFLGYRRGADGKPEIVPEEAETVRLIYSRFLAGDSYTVIARTLESSGIPSPGGKEKWSESTICSILSNERYKGDAIINKTYIKDCLSKKVCVNNGERPKYYVENNHPAIIDAATFGRAQKEIARRKAKRKVKQVGTKTEQGKYCGKYALTELLLCGECGTPYRRCTWTAGGQKKIVWRCIRRLDYGKKYCHHSPTIEESVLQEAIMEAVLKTAKQNADVLKTLKMHIGMGLAGEETEDRSLDIQIRIAEIDAEFRAMMSAISAENAEQFDERRATELMKEKAGLEQQLSQITDTMQKRQNAKSRLDEIYEILDGLKNHPMEFNDRILRQILECVIIESKEQIKVVFAGGLEVEQELN